MQDNDWLMYSINLLVMNVVYYIFLSRIVDSIIIDRQARFRLNSHAQYELRSLKCSVIYLNNSYSLNTLD